MPSIREARQGIKDVVNKSGGMRSCDLLGRMDIRYLIFDIPSMLNDLIDEGEVSALRYSLRDTSKQELFLLPFGSVVTSYTGMAKLNAFDEEQHF